MSPPHPIFIDITAQCILQQTHTRENNATRSIQQKARIAPCNVVSFGNHNQAEDHPESAPQTLSSGASNAPLSKRNSASNLWNNEQKLTPRTRSRIHVEEDEKARSEYFPIHDTYGKKVLEKWLKSFQAEQTTFRSIILSCEMQIQQTKRMQHSFWH